MIVFSRKGMWRGILEHLPLGAEIMKILLTVLFLGLVFSANVHAKKVQITTATAGTVYENVKQDSCLYECIDRSFGVSYHVHPRITVALKLLYGDVVEDVSKRDIDRAHNGGFTWCRDSFSVPRGQDWTLAWVIERGSKKSHIIDAREMAFGTCSP